MDTITHVGEYLICGRFFDDLEQATSLSNVDEAKKSNKVLYLQDFYACSTV